MTSQATAEPTSKVCTKCDVDKPFSEYHRMRRGRFGLNSWCKKCMAEAKRAWREKNAERAKETDRKWREENAERLRALRRKSLLKNYYGLTPEEYELLGSSCEICGSEEALVVDHDHRCCEGSRSCGKCVRGLLCRKCNLAIGHFDDDIDRLWSAINYLEAR